MTHHRTFIGIVVLAVLVLAAITYSWVSRMPPRVPSTGTQAQSAPVEGTLVGTVVSTSTGR